MMTTKTRTLSQSTTTTVSILFLHKYSYIFAAAIWKIHWRTVGEIRKYRLREFVRKDAARSKKV